MPDSTSRPQSKKPKVYIENRLVDTTGDGVGGTNWESSIETYTLPRVTQAASGKSLCDFPHSEVVQQGARPGAL